MFTPHNMSHVMCHMSHVMCNLFLCVKKGVKLTHLVSYPNKYSKIILLPLLPYNVGPTFEFVQTTYITYHVSSKGRSRTLTIWKHYTNDFTLFPEQFCEGEVVTASLVLYCLSCSLCPLFEKGSYCWGQYFFFKLCYNFIKLLITIDKILHTGDNESLERCG